jgi:signal transduction histidine kinase
MGDFKADIDAVARIDAVPTILDVVCRTTGMGFAAVARVTDDRWIACSVRDDIAFGLQPGSELPIGTTICQEIEASRQAVVVDNVAADPQFCGHHAPARYGFQSYISMPILLPDGSFFGTLCAIDPKPRKLRDPAVVGMFQLFADLIAFHLDTLRRLDVSAEDLSRERRDSELREQFIAVLGHDLRNPLASIAAAGRGLQRTPLSTAGKNYVKLMRDSVDRMSGLIDNVMDFARGRLGGGLPLELEAAAPLGPMLALVVDELRATHPERVIETDFAQVGMLRCDRGRIGQLLSNLVANALMHGAPDQPVRIRTSLDQDFVLVVENGGEPIPAVAMREMFRPFVRAVVPDNQQGLGLGLYIASEIARAHDGKLGVESDAAGTRFTFTMPALRTAQTASAGSEKASG